MSLRSATSVVVLLAGIAAVASPVSAAPRHHRHYRTDELVVTRGRGLPVPVDPTLASVPNFTGANGTTTDVAVLPDGSAGDGFGGFQTPGLFSYGLAGGGLTAYELQ